MYSAQMNEAVHEKGYRDGVCVLSQWRGYEVWKKRRNMSAIEIQYMALEDAPAVYEIMQTVSAQLERKELYAADDLSFIRECIMHRGFGVKAVCEEEMAGFLLVYIPSVTDDEHLGFDIRLNPEEFSRVAYMDSAAVLPEYRGRGLQRKMIEFAEQSGRLGNYRYLLATVSPDNLYSLRNLKALGYETVCRCVKYGGLDRYVMQKIRNRAASDTKRWHDSTVNNCL